MCVLHSALVLSTRDQVGTRALSLSLSVTQRRRNVTHIDDSCGVGTFGGPLEEAEEVEAIESTQPFVKWLIMGIDNQLTSTAHLLFY